MGIRQAGSRLALPALLDSVFISLHTGAPSGANEVAGGAYVRRAMAFGEEANSNPVVFRNTALVEFPAATASWGTVSHFALWTASSGGTMLYDAPFDAAKGIDVDDVVRVLANRIRVTMS